MMPTANVNTFVSNMASYIYFGALIPASKC